MAWQGLYYLLLLDGLDDGFGWAALRLFDCDESPVTRVATNLRGFAWHLQITTSLAFFYTHYNIIVAQLLSGLCNARLG
jgi:hypothetical protein